MGGVSSAGNHRLTEWFRLEGTLKTILFQPCYRGQGHLPLGQGTPVLDGQAPHNTCCQGQAFSHGTAPHGRSVWCPVVAAGICLRWTCVVAERLGQENPGLGKALTCKARVRKPRRKPSQSQGHRENAPTAVPHWQALPARRLQGHHGGQTGRAQPCQQPAQSVMGRGC